LSDVERFQLVFMCKR